MRPLAIFMIFFLLMMSCSASNKENPGLDPNAKLEVDGGDTFDWGKVKPAESPLRTTIKLFNRGSDTLHIIKVKVGCGCTAAPIDKEFVEPGGYATLDVTLTIGNTPQKVHKTVDIMTNDPDNQKFVLHLRCEIISPITFFPNKYLAFGLMHPGRESVVKTVMTNNSPADIYLQDFKLDPPGMKINLRNGDMIHAGGELELEVRFKPTAAGPFRGTVKFTTSDPEMPNVEIVGDGTIVDE